MLSTLDWLVDVLVPSFFAKLDSWYVFDGVSYLSLIAAIFVIWFIYRRFA